MNPYIGHESQLGGVEEHRLVGGKGDGMRLLQVENGKGLMMTLTPDRCLDIASLRVGGINMGYFSACGYVAPAYYEGT
ncbi:MAG: aldose 1-epimerase family protein, partial [Lachnospiraceae bacterium]|nr:aldose 1-epimerase family protein [Lachnospiraceae bacterium]